MPSEDRAGASSSRDQSGRARLPGGWQAAAIAALSALLAGYLGRPGHAAPPADGAANVSRVAEVTPGELPAALGTVNATPAQLARIAARRACDRRVAWVTVMRAPGQPAGQIRLQSGGYVSPAFALLETPVRVAIPFPAPYPTGRGTILALGTTTDAIVALAPPWRVQAGGGMQAQQVRWTPAAGCPDHGQ